MITHEEARKDLYYVIPVGYPKEMIGKTIQTKRLLDYISQQEKKDELLGLYREKSVLLDHIMSGDNRLEDIYMEHLEKIDNIEKELGEMK